MKNYLFWICISLFCFNTTTKSQETKLSIPSGHSKDVNEIVFSYDGNYLLSFGNEWILWDVNTGMQIREFDSKFDYGYCQFNKNNTHFVTSSKGINEVFDIRKEKPIKQFINSEDKIMRAIFTNDGANLLFVDKKKIQIYNLNSFSFLDSISTEEIIDEVTISADNEKLIVGLKNRKIKIFDLKSLHEESEFLTHFNPESSYEGFKILSGTSGSKIITCCTSEENAKCLLWNATNGEVLNEFTLQNMSNINISADGKMAAYNYSYYNEDFEYLYFLNTVYGNIVDSIKSPSFYIGLHPNNRWIAYGGDNNEIILYDRIAKDTIKTFNGLSEGLGNVWLSNDLNIMYFCTDYGHGVFQMNTKSHATFKNKHFYVFDPIKIDTDGVVGFKKDDHSKETIDYTKDYGFIQIVNYKTGETLKETDSSYIYEICDISPDLRYALCKDYNYDKSKNNTVVIIDLDKDKIISEYSFYQSSDRGELMYRFTKDGSNVIVFNYDCLFNFKPRLFSAGSLKPKKEFEVLDSDYNQSAQISCINISADRSIIASGSENGNIVVYNIETRTATQNFFHKEANVSRIKISEDKTKCAAVIGNDIVVFDMKAGGEIVVYEEDKMANEINFSPNAEIIIASFNNNTNKFYNLKGQELFKYVAFKSGDWVVTTPDGRFDGTEKGIEMLQFVKGMQVFPLEVLFNKFYQPNLMELALSGKLNKIEINANITDTLQSRTSIVTVNQLLPPPIIKFVNPENNTKAKNKEISIEISIDAKGADIDEILLFQNSKLLEGSDRGFKNIASKDKTTRKYTIQLLNGENTIKAIAFNHQRTESIPAEIKIFYDGEEKKSSLYVLAIGINEYKNSNLNLNYAVPDAEAFVKYLNYGSTQIFKNIDVHFIKNTEATKEKIIGEIEKIKAKTNPEDVFVFYYAGHGVMGNEVGDIEEDYFLVPSDVTQLYGNEEILAKKAISSTEIMKYSTEIKAQKQLLIMDACQSGGAIETFASRGAAEQKAIMQLARSTGIMVLAASGSEQFATEFNELGHGAFTYALLEGLKCQADGGQKDFKVTVSELKAFLEDRLPELTEKYKGKAQYPTGYSRGQDFPIVICK